MTQVRKVIKTGNSLALTIPSKSIKEFNIKEGDMVLVKINRNKALISYVFSGHPRQLSLIGSK
ncbi:MAG: AbrB/MazE/SpoVT family DNA-binding domain-containing protein [Candidatus Shapirobacteria bacterium]|jgi:antitoxin component of MazEF toxin-antitoxin module|nr:AbrB/MazE/SpoVT family DNA-binding domain-containing protein [Candidatus Shapirobacteria bacterium]